MMNTPTIARPAGRPHDVGDPGFLRHAARRIATAVLALAAALPLAPVDAVAAAADALSPTVEAAMSRERRVALIIGNGRYASSPLVNPVNDARAIGKSLQAMGFRVTVLEDATITQISDAVARFGDALQPGGVGLFFYAGHGMQIKGRNYLIPIGADIQREDEIAFNAFDSSQVLEKMEAAKSRINIVILDACRNNPFSRSFRSSTQGLAPMEAPLGSYVAFATAPAKVASDGNDGNGLYTQHLLAAMRTPGLKIEDVFKRTRVKVMNESEGQQIPWDNSSLAGDFYFVPTETVAAAALADAPAPDAGRGSRRDTQRMESGNASAGRSNADMLLAKATPAEAARPASTVPQAPSKADRAALEALYRKGAEAKGSDPSGAAEAFTRAADGGHPAAAYELGMLLKAGRKPLVQDLPRAHRLFVQAAGLGHVGAQYEAANLYAQGLGTAKDCTQATVWALKAAHGGSVEGALLAGDLNKADCSGKRNLAESAHWYRVAADKGLAPAQFALGVLYMNGEGMSKDAREARRWLSAAANQGNTSAKFYLERLAR